MTETLRLIAPYLSASESGFTGLLSGLQPAHPTKSRTHAGGLLRFSWK